MSRIKLLPQSIINKIAAGEVIERPASVIKELVENSIDANAKNISIKLWNGGKNKITIIDDGSGMNEEDALMCFKLHATSKIQKADDLNSITTLGFRGEALGSITAIADTLIHSKTDTDNPVELQITDGAILNMNHTARTRGTTITIEDLFRHLPARKKFLKSDATEYKYCYQEFLRLAIATPSVHFELYHNDRAILKLESTDQKGRIEDIYSTLKPSDLIEINYSDPYLQINGFVLHPGKLKQDYSQQYLYVNNRYIQDRVLYKAVKEGYSSTIPQNMVPAFFLFLKVNPEFIDVNIHPRKLEIKFSDPGRIYSALKRSIESNLSREFKISLPQIHRNFYTQNPERTSKVMEQSSEGVRAYLQNTRSGVIRFSQSSPNDITDFRVGKSKRVEDALVFNHRLLNTQIPEISQLTQIFLTYIMQEQEDCVIIYDQHAADERVNYEKIHIALSENKKLEQQSLLIADILQLDSAEFEIIKNNEKTFELSGYDIDLLGNNAIKINAIPQYGRKINFQELLSELIGLLKPEIDENDHTSILHNLACSLACHSSIRAGQKLSQAEMFDLLKRLAGCSHPYSCPHGRPIAWELSKRELAKHFMRNK